MALSEKQASGIAAGLLADLDASLDPRSGAKGVVKRYLDGDHDLPYMPQNAKAEFRKIAERSVTNWLPLISDTFAKNLFVDGYRPAKQAENSKPWDYWQRNGLDARQTIAHRGMLEYGVSYTIVLPSDEAPSIKPISPLRSHAVYEDPDDEWPFHALTTDGRTGSGERIVRLYDDEAVYTLVKPKDEDRLFLRRTEFHRLGVCPVVRFRERLDGDSRGIILPLLPIQDRVNESVFALMIALQYASFRQRWATGLAIPLDENEFLTDGVTPNPNFQRPIEPFEAAVNRLWVSDSPDARFGDFAQTDVNGHIRTYETTVKTLASISQTPPHVLLGDLVNIGQEALAAAENSTQRKSGEYETIAGEAWEQTLRLAAAADGDTTNASDTSAQVRWRDTEARSLAATVDALGKIAQMLMVPAEGLWDRIPGVTEQDVERWKVLKDQNDVFGSLVTEVQRQAQATAVPAGQGVSVG